MIALIVLFGLATYRLTRFVIKDTLIARQRLWVLGKIEPDGPGAVRQKIHDLLTCPHCVSGWLCLGVVLISNHWTSVPLPAVVWLAAWAFHEFVWRITELAWALNVSVPGVVKTKNAPYDH